MQRTKSKLLSILLSLVMLLSLLPTTALAADGYPAANMVSVDGGKEFGEPGCYYFKNGASACSKNSSGSNAAYNPTTGTLTLNGYNGGSITAGDTGAKVTVDLVGDNYINNGSLVGSYGSDITVTSSSGGTLTITNTLSSKNPAIGIETDFSGSYKTGNVTITGDAKVTIEMTHNGSRTYEKAYGIFARKNITISESASVDITCATSNNTTGGSNCNGLYAAQNVTIDTNGTIKINVKDAGKDGAYSYGIYPMGSAATLTNFGEMEVQWKKNGSSGGAFFRGWSLSDTDYAINEDTTNCYASYRHGKPYMVTVKNGQLTGPGVPKAKDSGYFLAGDTVSITPDTKTGRSGEEIPFKEWTFSDVTLDKSTTTASNSFHVPNKNVTVTAKHSPFVGTPSFTPTGTTGTQGTLTFKTVVKADAAYEGFRLVKKGNENNESSYNFINPDTTSTSSPYEYSYETSTYSLNEGNYYVVAYLKNHYYLSEKFTVSYVKPRPEISTDWWFNPTVFTSMEEGYVSATGRNLTISNKGTVDTGELTIKVEGKNPDAFTVSKGVINNIPVGGNVVSTVSPAKGLLAGTYTAILKISGDNVDPLSINMEFTVKGGTSSLIGDVNKDGVITPLDMQRLYNHLNGTATLADTSTADVNQDGDVTPLDMQRLYNHLNNTKPL